MGKLPSKLFFAHHGIIWGILNRYRISYRAHEIKKVPSLHGYIVWSESDLNKTWTGPTELNWAKCIGTVLVHYRIFWTVRDSGSFFMIKSYQFGMVPRILILSLWTLSHVIYVQASWKATLMLSLLALLLGNAGIYKYYILHAMVDIYLKVIGGSSKNVMIGFLIMLPIRHCN